MSNINNTTIVLLTQGLINRIRGIHDKKYINEAKTIDDFISIIGVEAKKFMDSGCLEYFNTKGFVVEYNKEFPWYDTPQARKRADIKNNAGVKYQFWQRLVFFLLDNMPDDVDPEFKLSAMNSKTEIYFTYELKEPLPKDMACIPRHALASYIGEEMLFGGLEVLVNGEPIQYDNGMDEPFNEELAGRMKGGLVVRTTNSEKQVLGTINYSLYTHSDNYITNYSPVV